MLDFIFQITVKKLEKLNAPSEKHKEDLEREKGSNRHALKKGKIDRSERRLPGNFCLRCLRASRSKRQFFPF
jgi:hypothetical protein